ncbi:hypothetical protein BS78_08G025200 [Paspalum vaginatum]|nr:hypothetical protein BS78_08G025200 [Paspalum vaginatum]
MALLGDPATWPDEDECFIPSSYAINASLREWENTAAVTWAMSAPALTGPKEVEAALREEFRLREGEVTVTRVKLCLDGIPNHAWDADIVERIISRRCALETIDTNLLNPKETKTVDLWAWTANPSSIPKKI